MFLLSNPGGVATQLLKEVVYPRVPCSVPGHLQSLAGRGQGQELRRWRQDAAVGADSMMTCHLKWDVVPEGEVWRGVKCCEYCL